MRRAWFEFRIWLVKRRDAAVVGRVASEFGLTDRQARQWMNKHEPRRECLLGDAVALEAIADRLLGGRCCSIYDYCKNLEPLDDVAGQLYGIVARLRAAYKQSGEQADRKEISTEGRAV